MPDFDPKGFKLVGDYLSSLNEDSCTIPRDAINRTVVGRYYYSAFLQLREIIKNEVSTNYKKIMKHNAIEDFISALESGDSHIAILFLLEKMKEKIPESEQLRQVYNSMSYLRALRNAADYDTHNPATAKIIKSIKPRKVEVVEVDFSKKSIPKKSAKKYSLIESMIQDQVPQSFRELLKTHRHVVAGCIEELLKEI